MTTAAQVARLGRRYPAPGTNAANEPRYPEPQDQAIKTSTDKVVALFVWVGGLFGTLAVVAIVARIFSH